MKTKLIGRRLIKSFLKRFKEDDVILITKGEFEDFLKDYLQSLMREKRYAEKRKKLQKQSTR